MANKIYLQTETAILFGSEAGDDVDWSTESIASAAGRQSAEHDFGAAPRSRLYRFEFWTQLQATPTVGLEVRVYIKQNGGEGASSDHPGNDDGTTDAAVSAEDKLRNLLFVGSVVVDQAAANIEMKLDTMVEINARHIQLVLWNASGATITSDVAETKARLTPMPDEIQ